MYWFWITQIVWLATDNTILYFCAYALQYGWTCSSLLLKITQSIFQ